MDEKASILVVDDDESICKSLTLIFGEDGYETETVATGREAIEKAQGRFFNLALLDIKLPDMEGTELIAPLKEMHPDIVVITITAYASRENAARALNEGASACIIKPLNMNEVLAMVREALEKQRLVMENRRLLEAARQEPAERKQATEALRTSEASFRSLITRNADGIIIVDGEGIIRFANPSAEALFERQGEEFLGQTIASPVLVGKTTEVEVTGTDGETTTAEMSVVEIEWEGEDAYLASVRDITERKRAQEELKRSSEKTRRIFEETVKALTSAVEMREPYLAGHQRRVTKLATTMARELGLPEDQIDGIRIAGLVHDIGKLSVPLQILSKPNDLTEIEYGIVKTHPKVGYDILKAVEFPWPVAEIVLQHHERMDGSGYPQGLSGQDILLEARILAVADVVEAMSYPRSFRQPFGMDKALEQISQNKGVLYDPEVVDASLKLLSEEWLFQFEEGIREMGEETTSVLEE